MILFYLRQSIRWVGREKERLREGTFCNQTGVSSNVSFVCWRPCEQIYLNIKKKTRIARNTLATELDYEYICGVEGGQVLQRAGNGSRCLRKKGGLWSKACLFTGVSGGRREVIDSLFLYGLHRERRVVSSNVAWGKVIQHKIQWTAKALKEIHSEYNKKPEKALLTVCARCTLHLLLEYIPPHKMTTWAPLVTRYL